MSTQGALPVSKSLSAARSRATMDALEPRVLLSGHRVVILLDHGTLNVRQPAGAPAITVSYRVRHRHRTLTFNVSDRIRTYDASSVKHVVVNGVNRDSLLSRSSVQPPAGTPGLTTNISSGPLGKLVTLNGSLQNDPRIGNFATSIGGPAVPLDGTVTTNVPEGDVNLDGWIDGTDMGIIIGLGYYGKGSAPHGWLDGDFNADGAVDAADIAIISKRGRGDGNYRNWVTFGNYPPAPIVSGGDLPQGTTVGAAGDGKFDFLYDPTTGNLKCMYDGDAAISGPMPLQRVRLQSASGQFRVAELKAGGFGSVIPFFGKVLDCSQVQGSIADGYDLGNVLPTGLTAADLTSDLTLLWQTKDGGLSMNSGDIIIKQS